MSDDDAKRDVTQAQEHAARFVGLVHALEAAAETALGDETSPLRQLRAQGLEGAKAARRSLGILEMLQAKTLGNLSEGEREELWAALRNVRASLEEAEEFLEALKSRGVALPTVSNDPL